MNVLLRIFADCFVEVLYQLYSSKFPLLSFPQLRKILKISSSPVKGNETISFTNDEFQRDLYNFASCFEK